MSKIIKLTKDSGHMVGMKARVRLGWAEEGNLPKKPILKAICSQYLRSVRNARAPMSTDRRHLYIQVEVDEETNQVHVYCFQLL